MIFTKKKDESDFARETDMTIYLSGSSNRYTGISLELQRRLEDFLGIDREAIALEEFRRSSARINSPSKPTANAFAIALKWNLEETKDLIGRAGYNLFQTSAFDRNQLGC